VIEKSLNKGNNITREHIAVKRPGYGIQPKYLEQVIGRTVKRDLHKNDILTWEDI
jgi:sialic acid synthase SpsE